MFLHIIDDEKFIDSLIKQFEKIVPGESIYLVNIPYPEYKLKYIKHKDRVNCATFGTEDYNKYISDDIPYYAILFHNFYMRYKWSLVEKFKKTPPKVWFAWGADLYQLRKLKNKTLLKKTSEFQKTVDRKRAWNESKLDGLKYEIATNFLYPIINKKASIDYYLNHFDFIVPVIKEDFELFKKYYKSKIKYLPFSYGTILDILNENNPLVASDDIFVGNSSNYTNNTIETFDIIKGLNSKNRKIIVPLSYGNKDYAEHIKYLGNKYFGKNFYPLQDFLPLNEYNSIVDSCGIAIMNFMRQQGMGNLVLLFFKGAKVFLNESNPAYKYFKRIGVKVFSIRKDLHKKTNALELLDPEVQRHNRNIIRNEFNQKKILEKAKILIHQLKNNA